MTIAALGAISLIIAVGVLADPEAPNPVLTQGGAVERLLPPRDSEVLRQSTVGIDLATGWTGTIAVNGVLVPDDQTSFDPGLNILTVITSGDDPAVELVAEQNCVRATIWRFEDGPSASRNIDWCFEVL